MTAPPDVNPATGEILDDPPPARGPRPFVQVLQDQRNGALATALTDAYAGLIQAAMDHEKKGTLTLTITVSPQKDGESVLVSDRLVVKAPQATPRPSVFFAGPDGSLTRENPRQPRLPMRIAEAAEDGPMRRAQA